MRRFVFPALRRCATTALLAVAAGSCGPQSDAESGPVSLSGSHDSADGAAPAPPADGPEVFHLPFTEGEAYWVGQGNYGMVASGEAVGGSCSATGDHALAAMQHAFDFQLPSGTPVLAARAGTVTHASDGVRPGTACYTGGGPECADRTNYVVVDHHDGSSTLYMHLDTVEVHVGDAIARGRVVGHSGSTGWSTGPHLHFQRQKNCGTWFCDSVPVAFAEAGTPSCNEVPVSENFDHATACWSATLARWVSDGSCVQAASDGQWRQCSGGAMVVTASCTARGARWSWCHSERLATDLPPRSCVLRSDGWYDQCGEDGRWYGGADYVVIDGRGHAGTCSKEINP